MPNRVMLLQWLEKNIWSTVKTAVEIAVWEEKVQKNASSQYAEEEMRDSVSKEKRKFKAKKEDKTTWKEKVENAFLWNKKHFIETLLSRGHDSIIS